MINVTGFEFIPIQSEATQKGRTRFIMLSNGGNTNWSKDTNGITGMPPPIQPAPVAKEKQEEENTISE